MNPVDLIGGSILWKAWEIRKRERLSKRARKDWICFLLHLIPHILADRSAEVDNVQCRRGLTDGCAIPWEM